MNRSSVISVTVSSSLTNMQLQVQKRGDITIKLNKKIEKNLGFGWISEFFGILERQCYESTV